MDWWKSFSWVIREIECGDVLGGLFEKEVMGEDEKELTDLENVIFVLEIVHDWMAGIKFIDKFWYFFRVFKIHSVDCLYFVFYWIMWDLVQI